MRQFKSSGRWLIHLVLSLMLSGLSLPVFADEDEFIPPMPQDPDQVDVYLLTVGRGSAVYALFGHTILRVVDRNTGLDMGFNWGIFDFRDPSFVWKFYQGDLNYQLAIDSFPNVVRHYRDYERRRVVQDRVNLTAKQKLRLYERLRENARAENLHYKYLQFRDNCSTRPRDHLDVALSGKIKEYFGARPSRWQYRDMIRGDTNMVWWVYLGLDQITNSELDHPIVQWDEMFLPESLRLYLKDMPSFDDEGRDRPELPLLTETQVIIDLPEPGPMIDPYFVLNLLLGLPLLGAVCLWLASHTPSRRLHRYFGSMGIILGAWMGAWGTILSLNWLLSYYAELQHNALLFLFWPVDWLFVVYAVRCFRQRNFDDVSGVSRSSRPPGISSWLNLRIWIVVLAWAHLLSALVLLVLWTTGVVRQAILPTLGSSGWMVCLYCLSLVIKRCQPQQHYAEDLGV